jgi:polyisoprenyl-phosphate glycosyltransferase
MPAKTNIDLSIVIPCYNEGKNLPSLARRLKRVSGSGVRLEIILVDNGSTDGSAKILSGISKGNRRVRIVTVKRNTGYGNGVWAGLKAGRGSFLCWTHADLQTNPMDCIRAYEIMASQSDPGKAFIKGSRSGRRLFDRFFSTGMSAFESVLMGRVLHEINAQPNLFHRDFLRLVPNPPKDFAFDLYFYYQAKKNGLKVIRFPVEFPERVHGKSSWNTGLSGKAKFIRRTLDYSLKLRMRKG